MANVYLKVKTDKEREEERCGGCDCFETDDGCECRRLPCSKCGLMVWSLKLNWLKSCAMIVLMATPLMRRRKKTMRKTNSFVLNLYA